MKKWGLAVVVATALLLQMAVVMPSGSHYCYKGICGLFFWGAHEHDGVWHLALISQAFASWPAKFPTFAGAVLTGYNALLDLVIRSLSLLTGIAAITWYFKLIPLLWYGTMVYIWSKFAQAYRSKSGYTVALLFFIFFGNSFSYFLRFFHEGTIWGASGILSMQSPQMLSNIQFALTLPLVGMLLILFQKNKIGWRDYVLLLALNFVIMGLKFYGGIVAIVMTGVFAWTRMRRDNWADFTRTLVFGLAGFGVATWIFYNPLSSLAGQSILQWSPLTSVHPIIEEIGLVYLPQIANLRNNLYAAGGGIRLVIIEIATLLLFLVLNWGTRIVGICSVKRRPIDFILLAGIATGVLMNILFIQRGEWWNTVQFLYYGLFLTNIYAAETLLNWWERGKGGIITALLIVVLTLPNAFDTARIFTSFPPQSYVSDSELQVLAQLGKLPQGVVLALPTGTIAATKPQIPSPLYTRYDTAYVAGLSGQQTYLNDLVQMRLTGISYDDRLSQVAHGECSTLEEVTYIYVAGDQTQLVPWSKCSGYVIEEIYQNNEATIYGVSR